MKKLFLSLIIACALVVMYACTINIKLPITDGSNNNPDIENPDNNNGDNQNGEPENPDNPGGNPENPDNPGGNPDNPGGGSETPDDGERIKLNYYASSYYSTDIFNVITNGTELKKAYDVIVEGVKNIESSIDLSTYNLTKETLAMLMDILYRDHTELFYYDSGFSYTFYGTKVSSLTPYYIGTKEEITPLISVLNTKVEDIINMVKNLPTIYDKEKFVHDYLCENVVYRESTNAHNAYGALIEGVSVCEGYAKAFSIIMHALDVKNVINTGTGLNNATGKYEAHAWNIVQIEGKYYQVDVTWDDQKNPDSGNIFYSYFNITDEMMYQDHTSEVTSYPLPVSNDMTNNYYKMNNTYLSKTEELTVDYLVSVLKANANVAEIYLTGELSCEAFQTFVQANGAQIIRKLGVSSARFQYSTLGKTVIFKVL